MLKDSLEELFGIRAVEESGGVTAEFLVDGPDIADWVEEQQAFRRACQVRAVLTGA